MHARTQEDFPAHNPRMYGAPRANNTSPSLTATTSKHTLELSAESFNPQHASSAHTRAHTRTDSHTRMHAHTHTPIYTSSLTYLAHTLGSKTSRPRGRVRIRTLPARAPNTRCAPTWSTTRTHTHTRTHTQTPTHARTRTQPGSLT